MWQGTRGNSRLMSCRQWAVLAVKTHSIIRGESSLSRSFILDCPLHLFPALCFLLEVRVHTIWLIFHIWSKLEPFISSGIGDRRPQPSPWHRQCEQRDSTAHRHEPVQRVTHDHRRDERAYGCFQKLLKTPGSADAEACGYDAQHAVVKNGP